MSDPTTPDPAEIPAEPGETTGARLFFDRPPPKDYLEEWASRLAEPPEEPDSDLRSFVVFRLESEWLALPADVFAEVTAPHPVHAIPHRANDVLLGMVNIRGQLRLAVSLHGLLGVEPPESGAHDPARARLLILRDGPDQWVCSVEEVAGIQRVARDRLRGVPSTFLRESTHSRFAFDWDEHTVGVLDAEALFSSMRSHCR